MSGRAAAFGTLAAGGGVLGLVVALLNRVVRPAGEIQRYAGHIEEAGNAIAANLGGVEELLVTRDVALAVPELAGAYLARLTGDPA
jgi:hypothetical protein